MSNKMSSSSGPNWHSATPAAASLSSGHRADGRPHADTQSVKRESSSARDSKSRASTTSPREERDRLKKAEKRAEKAEKDLYLVKKDVMKLNKDAIKHLEDQLKKDEKLRTTEIKADKYKDEAHTFQKRYKEGVKAREMMENQLLEHMKRGDMLETQLAHAKNDAENHARWLEYNSRDQLEQMKKEAADREAALLQQLKELQSEMAEVKQTNAFLCTRSVYTLQQELNDARARIDVLERVSNCYSECFKELNEDPDGEQEVPSKRRRESSEGGADSVIIKTEALSAAGDGSAEFPIALDDDCDPSVKCGSSNESNEDAVADKDAEMKEENGLPGDGV